MRRFSLLISRYIFQAVLPYFAFTWLLLSVILFVQQASRYSDLLFNTNLPNGLIWQLTIALVPNVIAFTCPVAVLVGVIIGLSRMQGDSEMVSLRAAGVGNLQIAIPIILLGGILSAFAIFVNLYGVPFASQIVRQVALQAALYKLESPIEPGTFNSEINNFTIYVKKGNIEKGTWENIFIFQEDEQNGQVRLITSKEGRIDATNESSEIVLQNASVITFETKSENKVISEKVKNFRLVIKTKREELIERISKTKETPEEMGLRELADHIQTLDGQEKVDAQILWQRRILLSITPLIFALLGVALVTKYNRGGRGFGVFLSLVSLIFYYLLTLLAEQLARTGNIDVLTAGLIPLLLSAVVISWLFISRRLFITRTFSISDFFKRKGNTSEESKVTNKSAFIDLTTGILDFDLVLNLLKYYFLTLGFLTSIYLIFTAFERWKFAGNMENGIQILLAYLLFLIPFIYINLAPSALMIATLATYIIKSRQNEIVTWTAAGISIYRLLLPCFVLMVFIGFMNFGFQEVVSTKSNRFQDDLLTRLRNRNAVGKNAGKIWVANENRIFNYEKASASDNEKVYLNKLLIFEFNEESTEVVSSVSVEQAEYKDGKLYYLGKAEKIMWHDGILEKVKLNDFAVDIEENFFDEDFVKPSHLTIGETKIKIQKSRSPIEKRTYEISLQRKYSTIFTPLIIILFTAPFALSIGRKGNVVTIGFAIGIWLLFIGSTNVFQQFGQSGLLSPTQAVWSPLVLFTVVGVFFIAKVKT